MCLSKKISTFIVLILYAFSSDIQANEGSQEFKDSLFICVDAQKDFMHSDGRLYIGQEAQEITSKLKLITNFAGKHAIKTIYTADRHYEWSEEISKSPNFKTTFPPHCMSGTPGMDLIDDVRTNRVAIHSDDETLSIILNAENNNKLNAVQNFIIFKDNFDSFSNPIFEKLLLKLKPKRVYVYGVVSTICVNAVIKGLLSRLEQLDSPRIIVFYDAIGSLQGAPTPIKEWETSGIIIQSFKEFYKTHNL